MNEPKQIEADPRSHSHLYELKPISRWYLVGFALFIALGVYLNGFFNLWTWYLLFFGAAFGFANVFVFPYIHLKKMD